MTPTAGVTMRHVFFYLALTTSTAGLLAACNDDESTGVPDRGVLVDLAFTEGFTPDRGVFEQGAVEAGLEAGSDAVAEGGSDAVTDGLSEGGGDAVVEAGSDLASDGASIDGGSGDGASSTPGRGPLPGR